MNKNELVIKIDELKQKRNAVIVAHNYQMDDIQEVADVVGDSLALSKFCAENDKKIIVFCGVRFMAESAKILSPEKTVLLAEYDAGCPMADMITASELKREKEKYPDAVVVCYINSSAEVKAESDICCTSSNAINIVKSIPQKRILFVPDKNLGSYVSKFVPEKEILLWDGYCITHHKINIDEVIKIKKLHKDAMLLIHPECTPEVLGLADFVGSTKQIIDFAKQSEKSKFIIGTEMGVLYKLKKQNPEKTFYMMSQGLICPNMKKTSLQSVYNSLKNMEYKIELDDNMVEKARKSLDKMLEVN
jgi:quinolinate synthase